MSLQRLLSLAQERGLVERDSASAASDEWQQLVERVRQQILDEAVPAQRDFILDRNQWVLALCSRQCGKGWSVARMMILAALEAPGQVVYYVRRTLQLAKETMWTEPKDGIPVVLRDLGMHEGEHYTFNLTTSEIKFRNDSCIRFKGIERSAWSDARGFKIALLVLDEMQEQDDFGLKNAVKADIPYTFFRYGGRFVGIGTPGPLRAGLYHDICEDVIDPETGLGQRAGWTVHRWTSEALKDKTPVWQQQLDWKAKHNIPDHFPKWLRDGLGKWATDDSGLMLSVPSPQGLWSGRLEDLPPNIPSTVPTILVPRRQPLYVAAGLDFGYRPDPCAVVVGSCSREEGVLRTGYSDTRKELHNDQLAEWLRSLMSAHGIKVFFADSADPEKIAFLSQEYGLPVVGCNKPYGDNYDIGLEEMRTMMQCGRLRIAEGSPLHEELKVLPPNPKELLVRRRMRPMPGMPDHMFDALRYLFVGLHSNYLQRPEPPMTPDQIDEQRQRMLKEKALEPIGRRPGITKRTIG